MKRISFENDYIYHIYNRGVEKRNIFIEEKNYSRFISDLQQFNSDQATLNNGRNIERGLIEVGLQSKKLVEILAFCLMPNHYHLLVQQKIEKGVTEFMRKIGTGYTNYFNTKYNRVGPLFQGKFKAVLVEKESHFMHLPHYIHLNPLELKPIYLGGKTNPEEILTFLKNYRWSSLPDYLGTKNFPTIVNKDFLIGCHGGYKNFLQNMQEWLCEEKEIKSNTLKDIIFD